MDECPNMTIEDAIKNINQINDRPVKIIDSVYQNVYKRKNEWYGSEHKELFYASIAEGIYKSNCIPLKKEYEGKSLSNFVGF